MTGATKRIISISKEELAQLPAADFHAGLKLIDTIEEIEAAVSDLAASDIIGFDTETRPSFKKGVSYTVSLLQLSTRKVCYLFRLNKIGLPQPLIDLLADPGKLKIGVSIHDDFHNLAKLSDFTPGGFVDLQSYVKDYMIADNSLSRLYGIVFGKRISKGQRLTNWEAETLTPSQQAYAALDALACIDLYDCISKGGFDPEKSQYLKEVEIAVPKPETAQPEESEKKSKKKSTRSAAPKTATRRTTRKAPKAKEEEEATPKKRTRKVAKTTVEAEVKTKPETKKTAKETKPKTTKVKVAKDKVDGEEKPKTRRRSKKNASSDEN